LSVESNQAITLVLGLVLLRFEIGWVVIGLVLVLRHSDDTHLKTALSQITCITEASMFISSFGPREKKEFILSLL